GGRVVGRQLDEGRDRAVAVLRRARQVAVGLRAGAAHVEVGHVVGAGGVRGRVAAVPGRGGDRLTVHRAAGCRPVEVDRVPVRIEDLELAGALAGVEQVDLHRLAGVDRIDLGQVEGGRASRLVGEDRHVGQAVDLRAGGRV